MERVVLRDGAVVADKIFRICNENCHFVYETRDGRLRVIDHVTEARGDNIILGQNILTVIAEQSESRANSEIRVKGHRNKRGIWGRDAIIDAEIRVQDDWVSRHSPLTSQHYGDASPEALRRRAKWEADKRASEAKNIRVEVFDLVDRNGMPWDIGQLHYVEIPPEGIFTDMECIELTYRVDFRGTLNTELTLARLLQKTVNNHGKMLCLTMRRRIKIIKVRRRQSVQVCILQMGNIRRNGCQPHVFSPS